MPRCVDDGDKFPGPPETNRKYNGLAIAGFICSFLVSLLGLILSIVGLNQIKKQGGKASLRVIMHTQSGQSLYDKTWTEK